jgi:fumarate hydratase class II
MIIAPLWEMSIRGQKIFEKNFSKGTIRATIPVRGSIMKAVRMERDGIGELAVPDGALYGIATQRAIDNFALSGYRLPREYVVAVAWVKYACATANVDLGRISEEKGRAMRQAAKEIVDGKWDSQFPIDVFQTGSGTSLNMNLNEVIANRAAQILNWPMGKKIHPNDDCNAGQSSNDVIPTASNITLVEIVQRRLVPALKRCKRSFGSCARRWKKILKLGRTHLMDAVPLSLGDEFSAFSRQIEKSVDKVEAALFPFHELPIGGTAVGTGLNAAPDMGPRVVAVLNEKLKGRFIPSKNRFEAQAARDDYVFFAGALDAICTTLFKIFNDLRLMNSGPNAGLNELLLPALQPGSSCMPAKVNPVLTESLFQILCFVHGNCENVRRCVAMSGHFQLNTATTGLVYTLFESVRILSNCVEKLSEVYVGHLRPNVEQMCRNVERSLCGATTVAPFIGYDRATAFAQEAVRRHCTLVEVLRRAYEKQPSPELKLAIESC